MLALVELPVASCRWPRDRAATGNRSPAT